MEFKKITPIMMIIIMMGAFIGIQPASAATSQVVIYDKIGNDYYKEVSSFTRNTNGADLEIIAQLSVNNQWRSWRWLSFDVYDSFGQQNFHEDRLTALLDGYASVIIGSEELSEWNPGEYTVTVSYGGNPSNEWPKASKSALIHLYE